MLYIELSFFPNYDNLLIKDTLKIFWFRGSIQYTIFTKKKEKYHKKKKSITVKYMKCIKLAC